MSFSLVDICRRFRGTILHQGKWIGCFLRWGQQISPAMSVHILVHRRQTQSGASETFAYASAMKVAGFSQMSISLPRYRVTGWCETWLHLRHYRGADKSLARPGGKQATATKLTFANHPKRIQKVVRPTRSLRQQLPPRRTKNGDLSIVFLVGSG